MIIEIYIYLIFDNFVTCNNTIWVNWGPQITGIDFQIQIIFSAIIFYPFNKQTLCQYKRSQTIAQQPLVPYPAQCPHVFYFLFVQYNILYSMYSKTNMKTILIV